MKKVLLLFSLASAGLLLWQCIPQQQATPARVAESQSLRTLSQGDVIGFADIHNTHAWLGIPYAAPPVGELRWRAPQPAAGWQGQKQALSFGGICSQLWLPDVSSVTDGELGDLIGSEDCLYLNIWSPAFAPDQVPEGDQRLPVMLWIHGGANTLGEASVFHGHHLASSQSVIVVTINYRLGFLGWFYHPALSNLAATPADASGNFGLLDMIASLDWVRDNIAAFGGDPNNITVFGESAGGLNVAALLASPLANNKFHRAIVQSGSFNTDTLARAADINLGQPHADANSSGETLLSQLLLAKRADNRDEAIALSTSMSGQEIKDFFYSRSVEQLYQPHFDIGHDFLFIPNNFRDGHVLPKQSLLSLLASGENFNRVPVMIGSTRDEVKPFMLIDPEWTWRLFGLLPVLHDADKFNHFARYGSDAWKALAVDEPANRLARAMPGSVFVYRFDWDETTDNWLLDMPELMGAGHGFELPFVFGDTKTLAALDGIFPDEDPPSLLRLAAITMDYWGEFARHGNPGKGSNGNSIRWPAWQPGSGQTLHLDSEADGGVYLSELAFTAGQLKQRLLDDEQLNHQQRCGLFWTLFIDTFQAKDFGSGEQYLKFAGGCQAP